MVGARQTGCVVNDTADRRLLARIANPLQLGLQSEQAFKLQAAAERWDNTFTRAVNRAGRRRHPRHGRPPPGAINTPDATGLNTPLENLIILVWAQATNHTFRQHGGPVTASVDRLDDGWEVVGKPLPGRPPGTSPTTGSARCSVVSSPTRQLPASRWSGPVIELRGLADNLAPPVGRVGRPGRRAGRRPRGGRGGQSPAAHRALRPRR